MQILSESKLILIARQNYAILTKYCSILNDEEYWQEPGRILKQPIEGILDLYLQSCMIKIGVACSKEINSKQISLLAGLTATNPLMIEEGTLREETITRAAKVLQSPPILLQLASLRDTQKKTSLSGLFFDAVLNIMLVMAYLSEAAAFVYMNCLMEYCSQAMVFFCNDHRDGPVMNEKYLFRKICAQDLEESTHYLQQAGEDFSAYARMNLYYRQPMSGEDEHLTSGIHNDYTQSESKNDPLKPDSHRQGTYNSLTPDHNNDQMTDTADVKETKEDTAKQTEEALTSLLNQLDHMVGLTQVKKEIHSLINLIKVKKLREKYCLPMMDMSYHMVFTGSPGTGKTTVARLIAKIYQELGLLSKGTFVETDRSGLVAGYVGQTALKVQEVVESAIGGVLFIDEAYSLTSNTNTNDFGKEAVDTLVKLMEDNREDLVIIVAGYTSEMKQFLSSNPGLISRFNKFIEFADYTDQELTEILTSMADQNGFIIDGKAVEYVKETLSIMDEKKRVEFGNARGIRNLFETYVVNQANRIVTYKSPTKEQLSTILLEDVNLN